MTIRYRPPLIIMHSPSGHPPPQSTQLATQTAQSPPLQRMPSKIARLLPTPFTNSSARPSDSSPAPLPPAPPALSRTSGGDVPPSRTALPRRPTPAPPRCIARQSTATALLQRKAGRIQAFRPRSCARRATPAFAPAASQRGRSARHGLPEAAGGLSPASPPRSALAPGLPHSAAAPPRALLSSEMASHMPCSASALQTSARSRQAATRI